MLIEYSGEGAQCQSAKLIECIVLQYRGELDQVFYLVGGTSKHLGSFFHEHDILFKQKF